ncbi:leucine dehydrogenase [Candidatus Uhrbacteria bacterium]|nr:leucine dehydrogenase [Candidatus Uhrbacteria bacterium]
MTNFEYEKLTEFDNHRTVLYLHDHAVGLKGFIALHRGGFHNPTFGATRFWNYVSEKDALRDALRLSRLMSYKSALAGLSYGGAKAVLIAPVADEKNRERILRSYASQVNLLSGNFITGTDVGLDRRDLTLMKKVSKFFVGFRYNPEYYTALGIYHSIKVCLSFLFGSSEVQGRSVSIQGLGKVGALLLAFLYKEGAHLIITDLQSDLIRKLKKKYHRVQVVPPQEIYKQKVDVFSPCALSGPLNIKSINKLNCKIIAGGANNQLASEEIGALLFRLGILYAPDYVVNAGGLISVVDEFEYPQQDSDRIKKRLAIIPKTLKLILAESVRKKIATNLVANHLAEKRIKEFI